MKINIIAVYDSRGVSYYNLILPTNSSKFRHCRNTERSDMTKHTYPGYLEKKGRLGSHYWNAAPVMAVPRKLNWPYNYFINLKLKTFPIIMISHLVNKELSYKSYFNDVIVSLLFTVKCKGNYRDCLFATYMNYKWWQQLANSWSFNCCNYHFVKP